MSPSNQRFFVELRSIEVSHGKKKKACWAAQFLMHRKRHLMPLIHQSKILSVMSATCDHLAMRKGGEFDKCKVRLVVQGQHMRRKGEDSVGDYDDAFSLVPANSGFSTILSLATKEDRFFERAVLTAIDWIP